MDKKTSRNHSLMLQGGSSNQNNMSSSTTKTIPKEKKNKNLLLQQTYSSQRTKKDLHTGLKKQHAVLPLPIENMMNISSDLHLF